MAYADTVGSWTITLLGVASGADYVVWEGHASSPEDALATYYAKLGPEVMSEFDAVKPDWRADLFVWEDYDGIR